MFIRIRIRYSSESTIHFAEITRVFINVWAASKQNFFDLEIWLLKVQRFSSYNDRRCTHRFIRDQKPLPRNTCCRCQGTRLWKIVHFFFGRLSNRYIGRYPGRRYTGTPGFFSIRVDSMTISVRRIKAVGPWRIFSVRLGLWLYPLTEKWKSAYFHRSYPPADLVHRLG